MYIQDQDLGNIEVTTVPVSDDFLIINGTYTASGRVLVAGRRMTDPDENEWYRIETMNDDGSDICVVYTGLIPKRLKANGGVRFMCYQDNRRVLIGDYILECEPDLDHCTSSVLVPVEYPAEIADNPRVVRQWSEIIISPDCEHMCWTTLRINGSDCFLGKLVRKEDRYTLEDVCQISNLASHLPDPERPGYSIPQPPRGGEVKAFVRGGRAISEAGAGESLTDGLVQSLDSDEVLQVTNTPGYEETTMFSPDETLGVVMSPRFSMRSNCAIFGLLPHPHSMAIQFMMNVAYMYTVAGARNMDRGNIGPALIRIDRSIKEGRNYQGVNLSDPEGQWVYCSPISWKQDSTKAMWNETTRACNGPTRLRLRTAELLDRAPSEPVPIVGTPSSDQIPYAVPLGAQPQMPDYPIRVAGKYSGTVEDSFRVEGDRSVATTTYTNFSDDGKSFTDGGFTITAPAQMFAGGVTTYEGKMRVHGEHNGEMDLHAVFEYRQLGAPASLLFETGEDGLPLSRGYATYDGQTLRMEDMYP